MARNRKKMALYEVIAAKRVTIRDSKKVEQFRPENSKPEPGFSEPKADTVENHVKWPKKPKMVQLNAGRVEISVPYQVAIAVGLGILLFAAVCYRAGQATNSGQQTPVTASTNFENAGWEQPRKAEPAGKSETVSTAKNIEPVKQSVAIAPAQQGSNVIVIQSWRNSRELVPVKDYFAKQGIETEILSIRGDYYLVTKQRYEQNPQTPGTEGYFARQKLIDIGSRYKAPDGFGSFDLNDAYGMKIN